MERFEGVATGKYTVGLGQVNMAVAMPFEDVNSMALTVVSRLLARTRTHPGQIGRL
jgi:hydroxymethylglutaryl-CoA synthase